MKNSATILVCAISTSTLSAADLPLDLQAKFIKIILTHTQSAGKVAIKDAGMTAKLAELGVVADTGAKVAYAGSEAEMATFKGKLIICPKLDLLPKGGSIGIVEEGGKPVIYLHMVNMYASGVPVSPTLLKIVREFK